MDRKQLLVMTSLGLLSQTPFASAAKNRRGDGFKTIPYIPEDAQPYYPPDRLQKLEVDTLIWPMVNHINKSGWVWTAESCQGHINGWSPVPEIRLVCRDIDKDAMIGAFLVSVPYTKPGPPRTTNEMQIKFARHAKAPQGWFEIRAYVSGGTHKQQLAVFSKFAEKINQSQMKVR